MEFDDILDAVRRAPTYTNYLRAYARLRSDSVGGGSGRRVALLSDITVDPVVVCLTVESRLQGFPLDLYVAPYNEHAQEILDPTRALYRHNPEFVILLLSPRAVAPALIHRLPHDANARREGVRQAVEELTGLLGTLRSHSRATILLANLAPLEPSPLGVLDWQEPMGMERALQEINHSLADWAHGQERVYIFDLAGLAADFGRERAFDVRTRLLADQPFATAFVPQLAAQLVRHLRATSGPAKKCLVLDLDNTLWGGIVGEDGPDRLRLGGDAVGEAYRQFQQAILDLHARGILLAVCSRNDEQEALAVLQSHPHMILRPEHFAAHRINWGDKVSNLQAIAAELGIGLDSLVFVDDDPFERQSVRERLPEVMVVDLPGDPALYRATLLGLRAFDTLRVTAEDRERSRMYREERAREQLRGTAGSLEDYLRGLEMEVAAVPPAGPTRARLFQLVHKTNQFNLTTRRYGEAEFDTLIASPQHRVFGVRVRDRLGDSGVVGLVVLRLAGAVFDIETFLLSCRVLGRSIESGILAYAADLARRGGATRLGGQYIPTAKNTAVRDLYARHGFTFAGREGEAELWEADLTQVPLPSPPWVTVREPEDVGV